MALPPGGRTAPVTLPVTPRDVRIERAQARLEALTDESLNTANPLVAEEAAQWATILIALRAA